MLARPDLEHGRRSAAALESPHAAVLRLLDVISAILARRDAAIQLQPNHRSFIELQSTES